MAICHIVRCDADGCKAEAHLEEIFSGYIPTLTTPAPPPSSSYAVPSGWHKIDGHEFCTYGCLAAYADAKSKTLRVGR
jgi:hypothetical protein